MRTAPQSVEAYIDDQAPERREILLKVRRTVLEAVPGGEERISYCMPAVFKDGVVVYYAAFKQHLGLFPPVSDPKVRAKVSRFAGPKGNLQFPYAEPIPYDLIAEVVKARLAANTAAAATGGAGKPSRAPAKPGRSAAGGKRQRHAPVASGPK